MEMCLYLIKREDNKFPSFHGIFTYLSYEFYFLGYTYCIHLFVRESSPSLLYKELLLVCQRGFTPLHMIFVCKSNCEENGSVTVCVLYNRKLI